MPKESCVRWGRQVPKDVAMATNFWLPIGYNFGCMIASDTLFHSRSGFNVFGVKLSDEDVAEIECLRVTAMATNFGTKIDVTGFV